MEEVKQPVGGSSEVKDTGVEKRPELKLVEQGTVTDGNGEVVPPVAEDVSQEIDKIRQELGIESQEIEDDTAGRLTRVVNFLGLKTEEVFGREQALRIVPELDAEKLESLHGLVELAEQKYELREQLRVCAEIFDLSVEEMRDVIDTTSSWTEDHSTRLTILGYKLANRMWPFDAQFKKSLWQAGLLHDVGKVATPKSILDKDGRPTPEERQIINRHPEDGDKLLSNLVRHNPPIADGTKHHEKWGGGGYSYDLRGNEIPFISQVLSVADVYDALSSERPYKQGCSPEDCILTVEEMSQPRQVFDDQGELVLDSKTGEPVVIPAHFSQLPVAHLKTLYENRQLPSREYFDAEHEETKIARELEATSPYSREESETALEGDRQAVASLVSGVLKGFKVIAPEDLKRYINETDETAVADTATDWGKQVQELQNERNRSQEVFVDALFLLIKSIDARYRAYHEGSDMDRLAGGQGRTENVIRYSLMLAQQMGMSVEEQKRVAMAAMFCDFGVLGIDETKVRSDKTLGVTSFDELKQVPTIGYNLLQKFTGNPDYPEVAKYFEGAEIGAAEAHMWADGKGGYGVLLCPDSRPSTVGKIVAIAYKYVAMRADNPYRGRGLSQNEALDIMRKGVGTEFDPEIWKHWEALYARDVLRVFKDRAGVVGDVKKLFKGEEVQIVYPSADRQRIVEYSESIVSTRDDDEKLKLCYEAARYAGQIGFQGAMERFIELAEPLAIQRGDTDIIQLMHELYNYNLERSRTHCMEAVRTRLKRGEVIKAIGVMESVITDFAEKGQSIGPELAEQIRGEIIPAYKDFVRRQLGEYREHVQAMDEDILTRDEEMLRQGLQAIGDDKFTAVIEREMERIGQERRKHQVETYIDMIREFADKKNDPFNGEHLVAKAESVFVGLTPENQELLIAKLENARRALYRRGYSVAFEQMQREAQDGNVHIVLELEKRIRRWMGEVQEKGIAEREFAEQKQIAYRQGVEKMKDFLAADDLGLEDIPRVRRWVSNIAEWQRLSNRPSLELLGPDKLHGMEMRALGQIKGNMVAEIDGIITLGDQAMLKRLVVMVSDYIVEPNNALLRTHELDGRMTVVRNKLFDLFVGDMKFDARTGEADKVSLAIHYFHKFCGGDGRGEIIGLTETQRETLQDLRRDAYRNSLAVRISNIARLGVDARISQLEREIEDLGQDRDILESMGEKVDTELFAQQINDAVYKSLVAKVTMAIGNGDVRTISLAVEKINKLIGSGSIQRNEVVMRAIREVVVPLGREMVDKLVRFGRFDEFESLQRTLQVLSGPETGELLSRMGKLKIECCRNYTQRLAIKLQIHGIKSEIDLMRQVEDLLRIVEDKIPSTVDAEILAVSQQEAERIIETYRVGFVSYKLLGPLSRHSLDRAKMSMQSIAGRLAKTSSGVEDVHWFEQIIAG